MSKDPRRRREVAWREVEREKRGNQETKVKGKKLRPRRENTVLKQNFHFLIHSREERNRGRAEGKKGRKEGKDALPREKKWRKG